MANESILKLKKPGEIEIAFAFVEDMVDMREDNKKVLGIFENIPEKLCLLPGVKHTLQGFIQSV